jgi:hypothetical protein
MGPDRLDVIDLEPPATATRFAAIVIALEDLHSQHLPALGSGDLLRMPFEFRAGDHA